MSGIGRTIEHLAFHTGPEHEIDRVDGDVLKPGASRRRQRQLRFILIAVYAQGQYLLTNTCAARLLPS